jgi:VIT1/CCC1 family predicted Fe2+/Mn2+ transporter
MKNVMINERIKREVIRFQKSEITEHVIYKKLAKCTKDPHNKRVLNQLSEEEKSHYDLLKKYSNTEVKPNWFKICRYYCLSKLFGLTFSIKLMEHKERKAQLHYKDLSRAIPVAKKIMKAEEVHEKEIGKLIDEERLHYTGSIVLGLNDAIVEFTGSLVGFALALQKTSIIAGVGLISGIAASLSMGASEYLSVKEEYNGKKPFTAGIYTGLAYFVTVFFLILPFLLFTNPFVSVGFTLLNAVIIIALFNFYVAVVKELSFAKKFFDMFILSFSVAAVSFVIGLLIRTMFNINI